MRYTPIKIDDSHMAFAVKTSACPKCGKTMVAGPPMQYFKHDTFPVYIKNTFEAQAKRADLVLMSNTTVDDEYICQECKDSGLVDFECAICGKRYPSSEMYENYGYPPEYLCNSCYETTPAKKWDLKIKKLKELHRYDFE